MFTNEQLLAIMRVQWDLTILLCSHMQEHNMRMTMLALGAEWEDVV